MQSANVDAIPSFVPDFGPKGGLVENFGGPNPRDGVDWEAGVLGLVSAVELSVSASDKTIYSLSGFLGLSPFAAPLKGSICSEQTKRDSTPTPRRRAQKSCAPKSRDPCSAAAWVRKSSLDGRISALSGRNYAKGVSYAVPKFKSVERKR